MSTVCVCGHDYEHHTTNVLWDGGHHKGCTVSTLTNPCGCCSFRPHSPQDLPIPADPDFLLVLKHYPNARKSTHTGNIIAGEAARDSTQHVLGKTWKIAAESIRSQAKIEAAPYPSTNHEQHVHRMEELIKSIAKHTLDVNKIQITIMQDFHELHSRLEAIKKGK